MKKNTFNICFSADNNYMEQLAVSIASILKNSLEGENFNFYVLNNGIKKENREKLEKLKQIKDFNIEFISINLEEFKNCKMLNQTDKNMSHYHVTLPTYFRYKAGNLFKDISKLLYLDCDVIVKKSLREIFDIDLKDKYCAMVLDAESENEAKRLGLNKYFNAGVILINLDLWRKDELETKLFEYTKNNADKILWQDQDVINIVCGDKIKEIGNEWNFQFFLYNFGNYYELVQQLKDAHILHLAGRFKPWIEPFEHPIFDEYYFYLSLTKWVRKIQEYKYRCFGKYLGGNIGGNGKYVMSYDELFQKSLNPVYSTIENVNNNIKNSIDNIYNEITNNYQYTNEEIHKTYEHTNLEIRKNYDFTSDKINDINHNTDEKINKVYSEITHNYDYTNSEIQKVYEHTDSKIQQTYEHTNSEIQKVYEHTDSKIQQTYEHTNSEIQKTYDYATCEINKKSEEIKTVLENKTNEKINQAFDEITNNLNLKQEQFTEDINTRISKIGNESLSLAEEKINKAYNKITDNLNKNTLYFKEEEKKLKDELLKNYEYFEKISLNNSEEIKLSFDKLLEHLKSNNEMIFDLISEYHEKQEKELLDKLSNTKEVIMSEILIPKSEEIKQEIREELNSFKNKEFEQIKELTENEINNTKVQFSEIIKQISKDLSKQQRDQQLDFEKQLLDMEMRIKELNRLLNPVTSVIKKFSKGKKILKNNTDERFK